MPKFYWPFVFSLELDLIEYQSSPSCPFVSWWMISIWSSSTFHATELVFFLSLSLSLSGLFNRVRLLELTKRICATFARMTRPRVAMDLFLLALARQGSNLDHQITYQGKLATLPCSVLPSLQTWVSLKFPCFFGLVWVSQLKNPGALK